MTSEYSVIFSISLLVLVIFKHNLSQAAQEIPRPNQHIYLIYEENASIGSIQFAKW